MGVGLAGGGFGDGATWRAWPASRSVREAAPVSLSAPAGRIGLESAAPGFGTLSGQIHMNGEEREPYASITTALVEWRGGDAGALSRLMALVYAELHRLAAGFLSAERGAVTLQPTALVHELYLKLPAVQAIDWKSRAQFFSLAARMMRHILVDDARRRRAEKRGESVTVRLADVDDAQATTPDLILVDAALSRFASKYPRQALVVELPFFGGLTAEDTVEALTAIGHTVSMRTVERDWNFSKAWLQNELGGR